MTATINRFEAALAPCGKHQDGETHVTQDDQGLITRESRFACGCTSTHEEFHDGSVHNMAVSHRGKVLLDEELRGA